VFPQVGHLRLYYRNVGTEGSLSGHSLG
jgi:hypothetical protein